MHTSTDGQIWDKDASYEYYAHGPLKRTVLGEDKVQGLDYTYTLQGWLKGINHPGLTGDPGQDGVGSSKVGRDAFGMSLGYYAGDYKRTTHPLSSELLGVNHAPATGKSLYNGNIAAWSSGHFYQVAGAARQTVAAERFSYDELNRIKSSSYTELGATRNAQAFGTTYGYDPNGNLNTLTRNDASGGSLDQLTYNYAKDSNGKLINNKLQHVQDAVTTAALEDVESQNAGNYSYDAIGNLTGDVQSGISSISWTPYGKPLQISKANGSAIKFGYDASGNRILKEQGSRTTYYVRDASGNVMATYVKEPVAGSTTPELRLTEQPIYGSTRIGQRQLSVPVGAGAGNGEVYTRELGLKRYELPDHLGNVRAVVSDKKVLVSGLFQPDVHQSTAYYAFGQEQKGRIEVSAPDAYRYGYNGKEKDQSGEWGLTSYDYGFRIYNPAIAKFLSVDPLTKSYPMLTPYQFASNRPIDGIDLDGLEFYKVATTYDFKVVPTISLGSKNQFVIEPILNSYKALGLGSGKKPEEGKSIGDGIDTAIDLGLEFKDFGIWESTKLGELVRTFEQGKSVFGVWEN